MIWDGMGIVAKRVEHVPHPEPPKMIIKSPCRHAPACYVYALHSLLIGIKTEDYRGSWYIQRPNLALTAASWFRR